MRKVVVIGGGPGGYVAAIRAAQLGAEVHLIEKENVGGTCLNVGCIPTKAILHTAELYHQVVNSAALGLKIGSVEVDWPTVMNKKATTVDRLVLGTRGLLKANGVITHSGVAALKDARTVEVAGRMLQADTIILAVGSVPVKLSFPGSDLPGIIDSTGALSLPRLPKSLVVVGGGVIGIEFAALYRSFGVDVTIVELLPQILPQVDGEIAAHVREDMTKKGVKFFTKARLEGVIFKDGNLCSKVETEDSVRHIDAEFVLVAVGRKPATDGIGLEAVGIHLDRGRITVNAHFETNVRGIYAIGDCNGLSMLAHAASAQGAAAVEHALGHFPVYFGNIIPACIYTSPEVASVGFTEEQLLKQKIRYKKGVFPLAGNGKSVIENGGVGVVKILTGAKYSEVLGVHIFGPRATELIGEAALAIRLEATVDELVSTIHAHPTVSEAIAEAALAVDNLSIHWPPPVRNS